MTPSELGSSAEAYRGVQRAAAALRIATDRRLGETTPPWIHDLAAEKPGDPLPAGWEGFEVRRLEEEARAKCPCRCHGPLTEREKHRAARAAKEIAAARARIRATLDRRLGKA